MAGKKRPAFPFYAFDWFTDRRVRRLTREKRATLIDLWCLQFMDGDPIPDDPAWVASECRAPVEDVIELLGDFFVLRDGCWVSERLEEEVAEMDAKSQQNRRNGRKGGRPKGSGNPDGNRNETDMGTETETETKPRREAKREAETKPPSPSPSPSPSESTHPASEGSPQSEAIHSESVVVVERALSLSGPDRRTGSSASTSEPVHAGELLRGAFGGRAV